MTKNTGLYNSGNRNSGNHNSGSYNSGSYNSGNRNSGNYNSGYCNSGYRNSGDFNSGSYNSGDHNSGYHNSGYHNSGDHNSGYHNSGDLNSGSRNSGSYNSGTYNSGSFNTNEPKMRLFNKDLEMTVSEFHQKHYIYMDIPLNRWIDKDEMTDEEKESISGWETMGGYLKTLDYKEACRTWWKENPSHHERFLSLPGFDADIFEEITGIDTRKKKTVDDVLSKLSDEDKEIIKEALK